MEREKEKENLGSCDTSPNPMEGTSAPPPHDCPWCGDMVDASCIDRETAKGCWRTIEVLQRARDEAVKAELPAHLRWKGEGPAPARWTAADGTVVYRSYADYCDD